MKHRRGDGNALWIVVAAVIALIVLGVVVFIFNKQIGDFANDTKSCPLRGGKCLKTECNPSYQQEIKNTNCVSPESYCCIDVG